MPNERLRAALLERGLTPAMVAQEIGLDPKTVERWVTLGRLPYRTHRYKTAALLGTDEAVLWPDALSSAQVAAAAESEIVSVFPHRWAVPPDAWQRLYQGAPSGRSACSSTAGSSSPRTPGWSGCWPTRPRTV